MMKYGAALACVLALGGCGGQSASSENPLVAEAQLVGDEAPPPNNELPTFQQHRGAQPVYSDSRGPGAAARAALRQGVINSASALRSAPCDEAAKQTYIQAFRDYAAAKIAMQRTQVSYAKYWMTSEDKRAISTVEDLAESGHITTADQRSAMLGSTAQGRAMLVAMAGAEDEEGREPAQPACRTPKPA